MDLKAESINLTVSDLKIEIQKELFREKWYYISADRLTESLEKFEIKWDNNEESQGKILYSTLELSFVKGPQFTLKERDKHQKLTNPEKALLI